MPTTDATKKKSIALSLEDISNLRSHHRLMYLYSQGFRNGLVARSDVRKYQENIVAILRAANISITLTDNVLLDVNMINEILQRVNHKPKNPTQVIQNN